jgi:hypothetical protein
MFICNGIKCNEKVNLKVVALLFLVSFYRHPSRDRFREISITPCLSHSNFISYEDDSKSFRTESITKYTITTINTCREATQRVVAAKLIRLTHKIAIQLHLVAESCTICSSSPETFGRILLRSRK